MTKIRGVPRTCGTLLLFKQNGGISQTINTTNYLSSWTTLSVLCSLLYYSLYYSASSKSCVSPKNPQSTSAMRQTRALMVLAGTAFRSACGKGTHERPRPFVRPYWAAAPLTKALIEHDHANWSNNLETARRIQGCTIRPIPGSVIVG